VRVSFARAGPDRIAAALTAVLGDPAYRAGADRVRASFAAAGGVDAAARAVEAAVGGMVQRRPNGQQPLSPGTSRP
jgi:UDP:flavonoid glycosyltransferase YjiC (YdhE family)